MTELHGTFDTAKADWSKLFGEAPKSIDDIDVIGLHDKTIGKKREFIAIDRVLEIIDEIERDTGHVALVGYNNRFAGVLCNLREFRDMVLALKGGEHG